MELSERQRDAVSELINIAFSRTGAALSELRQHHASALIGCSTIGRSGR